MCTSLINQSVLAIRLVFVSFVYTSSKPIYLGQKIMPTSIGWPEANQRLWLPWPALASRPMFGQTNWIDAHLAGFVFAWLYELWHHTCPAFGSQIIKPVPNGNITIPCRAHQSREHKHSAQIEFQTNYVPSVRPSQSSQTIQLARAECNLSIRTAPGRPQAGWLSIKPKDDVDDDIPLDWVQVPLPQITV